MLQKDTLGRLLTFWNSKIPVLLCVVYYVLSATDFSDRNVFYHLALFLLSSFGFGFAGYLINDWADIDENKRQGKINAASSLSFGQRCILLLVSLAVAVIPWFWLLFNKVTLVLISLQGLSYLLYSVRPFRIKERGGWGILFDSFYAHILPTALVTYTFTTLYGKPEDITSVAVFFFTLWIVVLGVRNIIMHQLSDYEVDVKAGVRTYTVQSGLLKTIQIKSRVLVPVEFALLMLALLALPDLNWVAYLFPFYVIYVFYREAHRLRRIMREGGDVELCRHDFFSEVVLNEFYEKWLPVILLFSQFSNPVFRLLLLFHSVLFLVNSFRFTEDLWFIYHVIVMQLKHLVWFIYHRLLLKVAHMFYYPLKHVVYWYVLNPLKRIFAK